jgi:phosphatidate cytidylyltransferase
MGLKIAPWSVAVLSGFAGVIIWSGTSFLIGGFVACLCLCLWYAGALLGRPDGHFVLLGLGAVIAACDIGAYFVGRRFGGPKLMPSVSPNKTVSGSVGGILAAVLVGIVVFARIGETPLQQAIPFSVVIAIAAQSGDLFESAVKRRLGVKDSGSILPGHGGLLDRFDGYLLVVPLTHLYLYGL